MRNSNHAPLDAVLFDAGGTLVRLDFEWLSETLAGLGHDVTSHRLRRGEVAGRRRYDASGPGPESIPGELPPPLGAHGDNRTYFAGMLIAAGVPEHLIATVGARIAERSAAARMWGRPAEGARATVDAVLAMGLRAGVVSNSDGRAEQHLRDCEVIDGIECVIDSHIVGIEKPDPAIFHLALERMGLAAERTIYVGDIVSVDVVGARRAGLTPVLIDPYGDYAPPGVAAIPHISALPAWIRDHRRLPAPRAGATSTTEDSRA
jgi:putative hydrolase of the HAD superfamily